MTEHELEISIPAFTIKATLKLTDLTEPEPIPEPPDRGTAFTLINTGMEANPGQFDFYICNPSIQVPIFQAAMKPGALVGAYVSSQIMPKYGSQNPFLNGLRAVAREEDYYHTGIPTSPANRLTHPSYPTALYLPRATRDLSLRMANYYIGALNPFFKGIMADESQRNPPTKYLNAYRTAVEWVEADLQKVHDDWNASVEAQFEVYKAHWGSNGFAVGNSAGAIWPNDGFTIEGQHITNQGEGGLEWMKGLIEAQIQATKALPNAFDPAYPLIVTWNYPDAIPGVYQGTSV